MEIITATCLKRKSEQRLQLRRSMRQRPEKQEEGCIQSVALNSGRDFERRVSNGPKLKMENNEIFNTLGLEIRGEVGLRDFTWTMLKKK